MNKPRHAILYVLLLVVQLSSHFSVSNVISLKISATAFAPVVSQNRFHSKSRRRLPQLVVSSHPRLEDVEEESERYNDDAFGLVFLTGGVILRDIDFAGTFLAISAIVAASTYAFRRNDARLPGVVALSTLTLSPLVSSLRSTGNLDHISSPNAIEISLCLFSLSIALLNWKRSQ